MHIDPAGHQYSSRAVDALLVGSAFEIASDRGNSAVGTDAKIRAPLSVDVEHRRTGQQHEADSRCASTVATGMPVTVPQTLDAALAALASDPQATVLAGGTDLMVEVNDGRRRLDHVISIGRLAELCTMSVTDGRMRIGAGVNFSHIAGGRLADRVASLSYAARTVGSPQIRNAGTIGGNVATASPAGDTLPVLVALGAAIEIAGVAGTRVVPVGEFFLGAKRSALEPGELVVAVHVPVRRGPQDYLKVGVRNAMVIAVASVAIAVDLDEPSIGIGLGSVGPTPLPAPEACEWVAARAEWRTDGISVAPEAIVEFARRVAEAAQPIDDHRSTADYRRHAIGVLAHRALERCVT
jgi:CO/xanthine dehydrogenase FAD-binding subunit